jgi:hypothetical protein
MAIKYTYNNVAPPERIVRESGEYSFTVVDWTRKVAKSSGNEMIELQMEIDGGGKAYENLVFAKKAHWKLDQFLNSIFATKPLTKGQDLTFDEEILTGARGRATFIKANFTGRDGKEKFKNEVAEFLAIPAGDAPEGDDPF